MIPLSKGGSMCINFVHCGLSCGAEFNTVAESQLEAEREHWGPTEQGGRQKAKLDPNRVQARIKGRRHGDLQC